LLNEETRGVLVGCLRHHANVGVQELERRHHVHLVWRYAATTTTTTMMTTHTGNT
jgi:hypothetical protein